MQPPETRYGRRADGVSIAYQVFGEGPVDLLYAQGFSDPVDHLATLEERVHEMRLVLDAAGSERAALFGVSESGPACVLFAATPPERVRAAPRLRLVRRRAPARAPPEDVAPAEYQAWVRSAQWLYDRVVELLQPWGRGHVVDLFAPSVANALQRRFWGVFERAAASPPAWPPP